MGIHSHYINQEALRQGVQMITQVLKIFLASLYYAQFHYNREMKRMNKLLFKNILSPINYLNINKYDSKYRSSS